MRARLIVIERIQSQDPSQMPFAIRSGHDPNSRAGVSRSGAQHMDSARGTSRISGGPEILSFPKIRSGMDSRYETEVSAVPLVISGSANYGGTKPCRSI